MNYADFAMISSAILQSRVFHRYRADAQAPDALILAPEADHFRVLEALWRRDGMLLRAARDLLG